MIIKYEEMGPNYGDAIEAVVNGYMCNSDITRAIASIKRGENSEYYKAVMAIVNSNMPSSSMLKSIELISI